LKRTLLRGKSKGGLYPLPCTISSSAQARQVFSTSKISSSRWHARLGHHSSSIVRFVLSKFRESVCDACQQAKCHQLLYPNSTSASNAPLELNFSDVWGPACDSRRHKYYVSFIDNYSKFTWIYLLKHKSEVFQKFQDFQNLVERLFDKKILVVQTDWGGGGVNPLSLTPFSAN
jgi:hypothetical protein